jgi:myo-inositol-1(or 4)-monophosphatase
MSGLPFEREIATARAAAVAAGEIIARYSLGNRESWDKKEDNPVTQADLEANQCILDRLAEVFPDDAILSEETVDSPDRLDAERLWVIDPLDGTKEFIEGVPQFAVSVALAIGGEPVVGVVFQPLTRECFWAAKGRGAYLGETRLELSSAPQLEQSKMLSSRTEMKRGQIGPYLDWFGEIEPVGSAAFKLALVACGRGDLWLSTSPKSEWDVCAGDILVREAGGTFVTLGDGERTYNQRDILLQPDMLAGPQALIEQYRARKNA